MLKFFNEPDTHKGLDNILESIGQTPLVRLHRTVIDFKASVFAKIEAMNPGLSAKDRIAKYIIECVEEQGLLLPGGTIIEASSGNTGFSLAMVAAVKGYKCVVTMPEKSAIEKVWALQAVGAEVHRCPNAPPEHPESYYSVAERIAAERPHSIYINQYYNLLNNEAHFRTTGPEIWRQTGGRITHFVCGVGTGGTISGTAKYLKSKNPNIQVIGVDAYGSALTKFHETGELDQDEIYSYQIEGVGKNIIPSCVDFELIDRFVRVNDKDSAWSARDLATQEGLLMGYSSGAVLQAMRQIKDDFSVDDTVVALFSDHGSKYFGKIFNDDWMRKQGFM